MNGDQEPFLLKWQERLTKLEDAKDRMEHDLQNMNDEIKLLRTRLHNMPEKIANLLQPSRMKKR